MRTDGGDPASVPVGRGAFGSDAVSAPVGRGAIEGDARSVRVLVAGAECSRLVRDLPSSETQAREEALLGLVYALAANGQYAFVHQLVGAAEATYGARVHLARLRGLEADVYVLEGDFVAARASCRGIARDPVLGVYARYRAAVCALRAGQVLVARRELRALRSVGEHGEHGDALRAAIERAWAEAMVTPPSEPPPRRRPPRHE